MKKYRLLKLLGSMVATCALVLSFALPLISQSANYLFAVSNEITVSGGEFDGSPSSTYLNSSPSGWTKQNSSTALAGIINVNGDTFANSASSYKLSSSQNPGKHDTVIDDDKILMINSISENDNSTPKNQGFKTSSSLSFSANSTYYVSILCKTQNSGYASLYLTGFSDEEELKFERIQSSTWHEYRFYVQTGTSAESLYIELWLGSRSISSTGAAFFDNVKAYQIEQQDILTDANYYKSKDLTTTNIINSYDFEDGIDGWTVCEDINPDGSKALVMNMTNAGIADANNVDYLGTDRTVGNQNALVVHNTNKGAYGLKGQDILITPNEIIRISVNVKVGNLDGKAYVVLKENANVLNLYSDNGIEIPDDFYTPITEKIEISSNPSDTASQFKNYYQTVSFYIKGHELYYTTVALELWLGYPAEDQSSNASGTVAFDNVVIENKITDSSLSNITTSNTVKKIALTTITGTPSIANGFFNDGLIVEDSTLATAESWTRTTSSETQTMWGIINTNTNLYNDLGFTVSNPGNPDGTSLLDVNNVLVLNNNENEYQSVKSQSFNISESNYYNLSFNYKSYDFGNSNVWVKVYDAANNVVFENNGLGNTSWQLYNIVVRANSVSETMSIELGYGDDDTNSYGYAFFDNVKLVKKTFASDADYATYVQSGKPVIDFTNAKWNLKSSEMNEGIHTALAYTANLEEGENGNAPVAVGGIIDGTDNVFNVTNCDENTNALKNMLAIESFGQSVFSLVSNDSVSLTSGKYYALSVWAKTNLPEVAVADDEYYGAEFSLEGLEEKITGIIANDEWQKLTIYISADADKTVNLRFALKTLNAGTTGQAFFDNYSLTEIDEVDWSTANENNEETPLNNVVFIGTTQTEEEETSTTTPNSTPQINGVIISSVIFGAALLIAIIGFALRKVKFKKFQKKVSTTYDRNLTLHREASRQEALDLQKEEIKETENDIRSLKEELAEMEKIRKQRTTTVGGEKTISRSAEKEFKAYVSRRKLVLTKIDKLEKQIITMKTDDYLLTLQRRINARKAKELKEENEELKTKK